MRLCLVPRPVRRCAGMLALLGSVVDGAYDGTVRPLAFAMCVLSACCCLLVHLAEPRDGTIGAR